MSFVWENDWKRGRSINDDSHALFGGSQHAYINWDVNDIPAKTDQKIKAFYAAAIGTIIHKKAELYIKKKKRVTKTKAEVIITDALLSENIPTHLIKPALYSENFVNYVNDGIGFDMMTEQKLFPFNDSNFFYGTADAIQFYPKDRLLRIHDLKTGMSPVSMDQLILYECFFLMQYEMNPSNITSELRIYQGGDIQIAKPEPHDLLPVIDKIQKIKSYLVSVYGG